MTKIPVGLAAGVWSDEVRPWVQHYLYDLKLKRIEVAAEHFDEVPRRNEVDGGRDPQIKDASHGCDNYRG